MSAECKNCGSDFYEECQYCLVLECSKKLESRLAQTEKALDVAVGFIEACSDLSDGGSYRWDDHDDQNAREALAEITRLRGEKGSGE